MLLAVGYDNGKVSYHYGGITDVKYYTIFDGIVRMTFLEHTGKLSHADMNAILLNKRVNALMIGSMCKSSYDYLTEHGIKVYSGVSGDVEQCVKALLENNLEYDREYKEGHGVIKIGLE